MKITAAQDDATTSGDEEEVVHRKSVDRVLQKSDLPPKRKRLVIHDDDDDDEPPPAKSNADDVPWEDARNAADIDPRERLENQRRAKEERALHSRIPKKNSNLSGANVFARYAAPIDDEEDTLIIDSPETRTGPTVTSNVLRKTVSGLDRKRLEKRQERESRRARRDEGTSKGFKQNNQVKIMLLSEHYRNSRLV